VGGRAASLGTEARSNPDTKTPAVGRIGPGSPSRYTDTDAADGRRFSASCSASAAPVPRGAGRKTRAAQVSACLRELLGTWIGRSGNGQTVHPYFDASTRSSELGESQGSAIIDDDGKPFKTTSFSVTASYNIREGRLVEA